MQPSWKAFRFDATLPKTREKRKRETTVWCRPRTSVQVNEPRYPRHSRAWQDHMCTPETYAQVTCARPGLVAMSCCTPKTYAQVTCAHVTCGQVTCARPRLVAKLHVHARDLCPSHMCTPGMAFWTTDLKRWRFPDCPVRKFISYKVSMMTGNTAPDALRTCCRVSERTICANGGGGGGMRWWLARRLIGTTKDNGEHCPWIRVESTTV